MAPRKPGPKPPGSRHDAVDVVRSEEELRTATKDVEAGRLRLRREVDEEPVHDTVQRDVEHADVDRLEADPHDSGEIETLPDGSISVPIFEEQIVVTKRVVVRERIVIRKRTITEAHAIDATVRRERVEIDADDVIADRVEVEGDDERT